MEPLNMLLLVLLLSWSLISLSVEATTCPYTPSMQRLNVRRRYTTCYYFNTQNEDIKTAQEFCRNIGGSLIIIRSRHVNEFIAGQLQYSFRRNGPFWIGVDGKDTEGRYKWTDGTSLSYNNFVHMMNRRNYNGFNCMVINPADGKWKDRWCSRFKSDDLFYSRPFICQYPLYPTTAAPTTTQTLARLEDCPKSLRRDVSLVVSGKYCFYFGVKTEKKTYTKAAQFCEENGGYLANSNSKSVMKVIYHTFNQRGYTFNYPSWVSLEWNSDNGPDKLPSSEKVPHCVGRSEKGKFGRGQCIRMGGMEFKFICQFPVMNRVPISTSTHKMIESTRPSVGPRHPATTLQPSIVTARTTVSTTQTCSYKWETQKDYVKKLGNTCYFFHTKNEATFKTARKYCQILKGSLVMIKSKRVNNFIETQLKQLYKGKDSFLIGLEDKEAKGIYEWMDGTPVSYNNFGQRMSRRVSRVGDKNCALIQSRDGVWQEVKCQVDDIEYVYHFICEYPVETTYYVSATTPTTSTTTMKTTPKTTKIKQQTQSPAPTSETSVPTKSTTIETTEIQPQTPTPTTSVITKTTTTETTEIQPSAPTPILPNATKLKPITPKPTPSTITKRTTQETTEIKFQTPLTLTTTHTQTQVAITDCPKTLKRDFYLRVHGTSCFRFEAYRKKNQPDAENSCKRIGGYLAMPKTKDLNDFIRYSIISISGYHGYFWIGLKNNHDQSQSDRSKWMDGTPVSFVNFDHDHQTNAFHSSEYEQDCVLVDSTDGVWYHRYCKDMGFAWTFNLKFPFVCEFPVKSQSTPSPTAEETPTLRTTATTMAQIADTTKKVSKTDSTTTASKTTPKNVLLPQIIQPTYKVISVVTFGKDKE